MDYKYTIRGFSELKAKMEELPDINALVELLKEADTLSQILVIDEFYNTPDPRGLAITGHLLKEINDMSVTLLFIKHIGIDLKEFEKDVDGFEPNPFLGLRNLDKYQFDIKLVNTLRKVAQQRPDIFSVIDKVYYSLVMDDLDDFIKQYVHLPNHSDPFSMVSDFLTSKEVSVSQKQTIFDKVLSKNEFASFDYDGLVKKDYTPFTEVVGLFNKLSSNAVRYLLSMNNVVDIVDREKITPVEASKQIGENILNTIRCNKANKDELRKMIMKLEFARSKDTKLLFTYLDMSDEYKQVKEELDLSMDRNFLERIKYRISSKHVLPEKISNKILQDLLSGKSSIEFDTFSTEFAQSPVMQKNYNQLLSVLMNEKLDDKTQRLLATTLLVGLSEKIKKDWKLEYEFVFNDTEMQNNVLGSYNNGEFGEKRLYFNKFFINGQKDWKKGFVQGVNTIYHELQHAKQFQHDLRKKEWNYDIMQQSMDHYIATQLLNQKYYNSNYHYISYESDARAQAYVNTMKFFEGYDDAQQIVREDLDEELDQIRMRCREGYNVNYFTGFTFLTETFIQAANRALEANQLSDDEKARANKRKPLDEIYEKYPSLQLIFNYNEEENRVELQSEEYFNSKLAEFRKNPEKNSEAIYCIENILYDNKAKDKFTPYNTDDFIYSDDTKERKAMINEMFEKVSQEIDKPPQRRVA